MNKQFVVLLLLLLGWQHSQANEFPVSSIAPALLQQAHLVKRTEDIRYEVLGPAEVVVRKKYVYTVLDEVGLEMAVLEEYYDALRQVKNIEGRLYDASGRELRSVRNKDIKDGSAIAAVSLYDDNRVKRHSFDYHQFPCTVAYDVTIRIRHTFYFEPWMPQEGAGIAVEESRFTLVTPQGFDVRTRACNYAGTPVTTLAQGHLEQVWTLRQQKALVRPYAAPAWQQLATMVYVAPNDFEVAGNAGNMSSWAQLGKFVYRLNEGRDALPEPVLQQVKTLCSGLHTTTEKVAALYRYLQDNTRYISVQLGIGSWQPFDAAYVARNRYGDCKALTNFMYSLLKAAGINSYYALIRAGYSREDRQLEEDFPRIQFNHAVLCVPQPGGKDTIWLECTSQSDPMGYMGGFTGNRKALLITPDGGMLVRTPRYGREENLQERSLKGTLDGAGNLLLHCTTRYTGLQQDDQQELAANPNKQKVTEALNREFDLPSYEVTDFRYQQFPGIIPALTEQLTLDVPRFATVSGKRLFIQPNILAQSSVQMSLDTARHCDYLYDLAYRDVDSVEIDVPAGYVPESLPKPVHLQTKFGQYRYAVQLSSDKVKMVRLMERYAVQVPAAEGAALVDFWAAIYKADRSRLVLVRKE